MDRVAFLQIALPFFSGVLAKKRLHAMLTEMAAMCREDSPSWLLERWSALTGRSVVDLTTDEPVQPMLKARMNELTLLAQEGDEWTVIVEGPTEVNNEDMKVFVSRVALKNGPELYLAKHFDETGSSTVHTLWLREGAHTRELPYKPRVPVPTRFEWLASKPPSSGVEAH